MFGGICLVLPLGRSVPIHSEILGTGRGHSLVNWMVGYSVCSQTESFPHTVFRGSAWICASTTTDCGWNGRFYIQYFIFSSHWDVGTYGRHFQGRVCLGTIEGIGCTWWHCPAADICTNASLLCCGATWWIDQSRTRHLESPSTPP